MSDLAERLKALLAEVEAGKAAPSAPTSAPTPQAPSIDYDALASAVAERIRPAPMPSARPISDHGSPTRGQVADWKSALRDRPLNLSRAELAQMDSDLGVEVARRQRLDAVNRIAPYVKVRGGGERDWRDVQAEEEARATMLLEKGRR